MSEWQPIETAPKDRPIIGYGPHEGMGIIQWRSGLQMLPPTWLYQAGGHDAIEFMDWGGTDYRVFSVVTHWMPLPDAPSEKENVCDE